MYSARGLSTAISTACALVERWEKERGTGVRETSLRYFISTVHGSVSLVHFVCDGRSGVVNALGLSGAPSADGNHIPPSTLPTTRADRPEELRTVMDAVHR